MNKNKISKLEDYTVKARKIILERYFPDSCVLSTAVTIELCKKLGIKGVEPLSCTVVAYNPELTEKMKEKGRFITEQDEFNDAEYSVGVGFIEGKHNGLKGWGGHLIAVGKDFLVDLSLDQASRPERGMNFTPLLWLAETSKDRQRLKDFIHGDINLIVMLENGCTLSYHRIELDHTVSPDWINKDRRIDIVKKVLDNNNYNYLP